jgi:hypothetical protein
MPLTLTLTEGVVPAGAEQKLLVDLCDAMLRWHGLSNHPVMTPNVLGSIHVLPRASTFAGLENVPIATVEWKVPAVAFSDRDVQLGYVQEATELVHRASNGQQPKERIWVSVVHAVDGTWGIAGNALTNEQLAQALR